MSTRISVSLFLIAAFAIVAVAGRSLVQESTANTTQNVLVTNNTSQAVPVKPAAGSAFATAIVNTPNVHAFVTNAATAPVPTTDVRDKNRFRQIFSFIEQDAVGSDSKAIAVPAGKRLIIDCVDAYSTSANDYQFFSNVDIGSHSASAFEDHVDLALNPPTGYTTFAMGEELTSLSAEPGETVNVSVARSSSNEAGEGDIFVTLLGHWVSVP